MHLSYEQKTVCLSTCQSSLCMVREVWIVFGFFLLFESVGMHLHAPNNLITFHPHANVFFQHAESKFLLASGVCKRIFDWLIAKTRQDKARLAFILRKDFCVITESLDSPTWLPGFLSEKEKAVQWGNKWWKLTCKWKLQNIHLTKLAIYHVVWHNLAFIPIFH